MSRCVIIGGAEIGSYSAICERLKEDDFNIFCDSGLRHIGPLGIRPNLIVGDFDSYENPHLSAETIVLPCEKDDTDTVFAVKEALRRGFDDFLLIGAVGARLDHTLGNVYILQMLHEKGKTAAIIDDYSEMELVSKEPVFVDDSFAFFSLLNISGVARGITVENAKYPLQEAEITPEYQYGISNEVLPGKLAKVSVSDGSVLLIKVFKE